MIEKLSLVPEVARLDDPDWKEAECLVHAFSDLEEEFERFRGETLPRLLAAEPEEVLDALEAIREQARHILYHLRTPRFFDVLWPVEDWVGEQS